MARECKGSWSTKIPRQTPIKAGTKVTMSHVWNTWGVGNAQPDIKDIEITTDKDCTLMEAICMVEDAALEHVKAHSAEDIRLPYFIEDLIFTEGAIDIIWGT